MHVQFSKMKGKPTASGEQVIINNVFKYFNANNPSDRDHSLFKSTAQATGSSFYEKNSAAERWT